MPNNLTPKPSFSLFYWKPWNENSNFFESWIDYNKDLSLIDYSAGKIGQHFDNISKEQLRYIGELGENLGITIESVGNQITNTLCDNIERGTTLITQKMDSVEKELSILNGKTELILEQIEINNIILSDIFNIIKLPEDQKKRLFHTELGLKFLLKANLDEDLYEDSLNEFTMAEKIMPQDYFVMHKIGLIYTYSRNHLSITKALEYFKKAAKYSSIDSVDGDKYFSLYLNKNSNKQNNDDYFDEDLEYGDEVFDSITPKSFTPKYITTDSYKKAAFCSYILGDFEEAVRFQSKATDWDSSSSNYFLLSKYLARKGRIKDSLESLDNVIENSPHLIKGVFKDLDFINQKEILMHLQQKNDYLTNLINSISTYVNNCESVVNKTNAQLLETLKHASFEEKASYIIEYKKKVEILKSDIKILINSYQKFETIITPNKDISLDKLWTPIYSIEKKFVIEDSKFNLTLDSLINFEYFDYYNSHEIYIKCKSLFDNKSKEFLSTLTIQNLDLFFRDAAELVVKWQSGSASLINRNLGLNFDRSSRLIDQLVLTGIVSEFKEDENPPRTVLVKNEKELNKILSKCLKTTKIGYKWTPSGQNGLNDEPKVAKKVASKKIKQNETKFKNVKYTDESSKVSSNKNVQPTNSIKKDNNSLINKILRWFSP